MSSSLSTAPISTIARGHGSPYRLRKRSATSLPHLCEGLGLLPHQGHLPPKVVLPMLLRRPSMTRTTPVSMLSLSFPAVEPDFVAPSFDAPNICPTSIPTANPSSRQGTIIVLLSPPSRQLLASPLNFQSKHPRCTRDFETSSDFFTTGTHGERREDSRNEASTFGHGSKERTTGV